MRELDSTRIEEAVAEACMDASCNLPDDIAHALREAQMKETSPYGLYALDKICKNIDIAAKNQMPLCQDTGLVVVFAEVGQDLHITGASLHQAINAGVARACKELPLRASLVDDPLFERVNTQNNTPAVLHITLVEGSALRLFILPKGGGSENMTSLRMLTPAEGEAGVKEFVVDSVRAAGGNPCPPTIVGVGVGGNAESAVLLSKKALLRKLDREHPHKRYAALERELLNEINGLGIGPAGFGGLVSALAVHIEYMPTHIATLPVAVTLSCHATRHIEVIL